VSGELGFDPEDEAEVRELHGLVDADVDADPTVAILGPQAENVPAAGSFDTAAVLGLLGPKGPAGSTPPTGSVDERARLAEQNGTRPLEAPEHERLLKGGAFILDQPAETPAVWRGAAGGGTAWAVGEGLMVVGPDGVGKTTVMQQISLGRIGLRQRVLGMELAIDDRPLLYLALDRPAQIQRSFARMVTDENRDVLDRRLIIWRGPPPFDIVKQPRALADFAEEQGAGTVAVDSLKDLALKLSDDEVGGRVNEAFQHLLERGIEVLCSHHQRKAQAGGGAPKRLADVYGSRWITAGMGSVFMLWGEAGDLEIECLHLKQPDEELGPWKLLHDHRGGKTVIVDQVNLLELVTARGDEGLTADQAAALLFDSSTPARNEIEKARRRLDKLAEQDFVARTGAKPDPVFYRRKQP
jgi:hypothetical protein